MYSDPNCSSREKLLNDCGTGGEFGKEQPFRTWQKDAGENLDYGPTTDHGGLSSVEKRFLLLVERGDVASIKRILEAHKGEPEVFSIDCTDPLGRSALTMAIENENSELIHLLLQNNIKVKDALLHAIKEEYVEAVETLLEWEEQHHVPGTPYSWEAADRDTATFTPDITPLILAAHKNNYEILKILLDRGATLPVPHHVKCGCDLCLKSSQEDSLRYSRSRINAYRALASPSLICLSSKDPFLTAFELSWELRRLAKAEAEFRADYNELRSQCQEFATTLLGHARTSIELQTLLNHKGSNGDDPSVPQELWEPGDKQSLHRLKLAIKYKQKKFVAHPSVQQLLASMWYDGLPGFRRKSLGSQFLQILQLGIGFPIYSLFYMIFPTSEKGKFMRKPFVKFITHSSSYMLFLVLLAAASQRFEFVFLEWLGNMLESEWIQVKIQQWKEKERGAFPGFVESIIIFYVFGYVWSEAKELYSNGVLEYLRDLWNIVDFITNALYVAWFALRMSAYYIVMYELKRGEDPYYKREHWSVFDPMLISEGMFGAGMIFSFLKLVHIFSVNPHLGPLQISLGRMTIDILKFLIIYALVLFAFGCGLNQLLWYYADLEKAKCYSLPGDMPDYESGDSCFIWRRFANLFETSQSLFWASFGLVELEAFELTGIKSFTRFWALLMFGSYSVINVIVLINMLIAMMSTSYQKIVERSDAEWKFARSKLWISYFDEGATVPPPFNIIPTMKTIGSLIGCRSKLQRKHSERQRVAMGRYFHISRLLVRRYVSAEEAKKQEQAGISEDDVNEIRQDISSFRFELIDTLKLNGMRTPNIQPHDMLVSGRKGKVMERRLMKDFQIGVIENAVREAILNTEGDSKDVFARIARAIARKKEPKDWNAIVRHVSVKSDPIGSKQASLKRRSARRRRVEIENAVLFSMDPERLAEYNPKLQGFTPATRVAYAKFKTKMLISHVNDEPDSPTVSRQSSATSAPPDTPKAPGRRIHGGKGPPPLERIDSIKELPILDPIFAKKIESYEAMLEEQPIPEPLPSTDQLESEREVQLVEVKVEREPSIDSESFQQSHGAPLCESTVPEETPEEVDDLIQLGDPSSSVPSEHAQHLTKEDSGGPTNIVPTSPLITLLEPDPEKPSSSTKYNLEENEKDVLAPRKSSLPVSLNKPTSIGEVLDPTMSTPRKTLTKSPDKRSKLSSGGVGKSTVTGQTIAGWL